MSPSDSAALALALDEYAPSDAAQANILRRVLRAINTDVGQTGSSDGSRQGTSPPLA